jgi:WD40 repeat protein
MVGIVVFSFDATCTIWMADDASEDAAALDCVATLEGHENEVKGVAFHSSGSLLATCGRDKTVWIWECQLVFALFVRLFLTSRSSG